MRGPALRIRDRVWRLALLAVALLLVLDAPPSAAVGYRTNLWSGGVIPIANDPALTPAQATMVTAAISVWTQAANVSFRAPVLGDLAWVLVRDSSSDLVPANYVGNIGVDGIGHGFLERKVNIASWNTFTIVHELGHILGLVHEQNRYDRDAFVTIETANTPFGLFDFNFVIDPFAEAYGGYDFDSIMHYSACAFSICSSCSPGNPGCRTITVLPPYDVAWQSVIGQRDHLSYVDQVAMSFLYPESDWRFVDGDDGTLVPNGSFLDPWPTFADGASLTPVGGTLWIQPGAYAEPITLDRPMTIRAPLGGVTVGP